MSNATTLHFTMQSNLVLTANFAEIARPALQVTAPVDNQVWSNSVATGTINNLLPVVGTAGDIVGVTNVYYSLNNGGWNPALTRNGYTNWTGGVVVPNGTNVLEIYAVNVAGICSATSSVPVIGWVTAPLGVRVNGLGTVSPNDSNVWLVLGRNYTLTATPATGFVFTNWGVTNAGVGAWGTNKATVEFMMTSNLTLTASFVETTKPVVTITSPTANQKVGGAALTIKGTASDNWQVTSVWCQLNSNTWFAVSTTNNFKTWFVTNVSLGKGTNVIRAYGVNLGGSVSLTNSVTVVATNAPVNADTLARSLVADGAAEVLITGAQMTPGGLAFNLQITGAASGDIEVSTNLLTWETVAAFAGTNGTVQFTDPGATNASSRFYRAVGR
jgi:hypothetical protein